jgi:hypothetical protein
MASKTREAGIAPLSTGRGSTDLSMDPPPEVGCAPISAAVQESHGFFGRPLVHALFGNVNITNIPIDPVISVKELSTYDFVLFGRAGINPYVQHAHYIYSEARKSQPNPALPNTSMSGVYYPSPPALQMAFDKNRPFMIMATTEVWDHIGSKPANWTRKKLLNENWHECFADVVFVGARSVFHDTRGGAQCPMVPCVCVCVCVCRPPLVPLPFPPASLFLTFPFADTLLCSSFHTSIQPLWTSCSPDSVPSHLYTHTHTRKHTHTHTHTYTHTHMHTNTHTHTHAHTHTLTHTRTHSYTYTCTHTNTHAHTHTHTHKHTQTHSRKER